MSNKMDKADYSSDEEIAFLQPKRRESSGSSMCLKFFAMVSLLTSVFALILMVISGVSTRRDSSSTSQSISTTFAQIFHSDDSTSCSSAASLTSGHADSNTNTQGLDCGTTMDSALANGCVFDEMLNGWVPPRCHNETMAQEALRDNTELAELHAAGHFPWYEDFEFTRPIAQGHLPHYLQSERSNMTAYTLEKWHMAHCLYVWRLGMLTMNRIQNGEKDVYANIRITGEGHITHCNHVIADQEHRVGAKAIVSFGYGRCARMT